MKSQKVNIVQESSNKSKYFILDTYKTQMDPKNQGSLSLEFISKMKIGGSADLTFRTLGNL